MSNLLLDTHILLWGLLDPDLLAPQLARELENPENEIWVSPITTWEVIVLAEKGKIELDEEPVGWIKNVLKAIPFKEAALNHEVAMQSRKIRMPHQDPADRFLAATAVVFDLQLATADRILIENAGSYSVFPNS